MSIPIQRITGTTYLSITLSVSSPENNNLVHLLLLLELPNVLPDGVHLLLPRALDQVVGTCFLVGSNKIRIIDACTGTTARSTYGIGS